MFLLSPLLSPPPTPFNSILDLISMNSVGGDDDIVSSCLISHSITDETIWAVCILFLTIIDILSYILVQKNLHTYKGLKDISNITMIHSNTWNILQSFVFSLIYNQQQTVLTGNTISEPIIIII